MSFLKDLIESTFPVAFADEPSNTHEKNSLSESPEKSEVQLDDGEKDKEEEEESEGSNEAEDEDDDEDDEDNEDEDEEDEDEDETKDPLDEMREECKKSEACHGYLHHFQECVERVKKEQEEEDYAHKAYKEDCVEEFFHLQHCINDCVAPKLFYKLK